jgi:pimeloyl-ACP methyl ester carboxylesterase
MPASRSLAVMLAGAAVFASIGTGQRPPLPYTLDDMAKDAIGLLDALGVARAHVVGVSMGGMIAQIIAARYPARTLSLTSIMAASGNPAFLAPARPELLASIPPEPEPGDREAAIARQIKVWERLGSPRFRMPDAVVRERVTQAITRAYHPAGTARQGAATLASGDRREAMRSIHVPTVVVQGAADPLVAPAAGSEVAALILGAELRMIAGMGHDLPDAVVPTLVDAINAAIERAPRP